MSQSKAKTAETKKQQHKQNVRKTEAEAKEADGEFSEVEVRNDVETVRETDEKNILDIAHKRTRRQVPSCYMSDTTWTRERRPPSRMKRLAM